jgi:hypothetical protein
LHDVVVAERMNACEAARTGMGGANAKKSEGKGNGEGEGQRRCAEHGAQKRTLRPATLSTFGPR